jgi:DNA mismatch repair protein MutS2
MENTRRESEAILSDLRRLRKSAGTEADVNSVRKRLDKDMDELAEGLKTNQEDASQAPKTVNPGDRVKILTINQEGTVLSKPDDKGDVQLQAGIMKFKANLSQLRLLKKTEEKQKTSVMAKTGAMERTVRMECDVRGMTLDEAILTVDQYLDAAIMAGMGEVSIIHGKGTGVLRSGIQQELRRHPHVKKQRLGIYGEGEDGVTIVTLK